MKIDKNIIVYPALIIFSSILLLLFGEISYRFYQYYFLDRPVFGGGGRFDPFASPVIGHPLLHYVPNPRLPDVSPNLFRITPDVKAPEYRIAALGGSSTFGVSVQADMSYPAQLQDLFRTRGPRVKVYNAGVSGWRLVHNIARYVFQIRELLEKDDLVVLYIGANDVWAMMRNETSELAFRRMMKVYEERSEFWAGWRLLNLIRHRGDILACRIGVRPIFGSHLFFRAYRKSPCKFNEHQDMNDAELRLFESRLIYLLNLIRRDGFLPLVVLQDSPLLNSDDPWGKNMRKMRNLIADTASGLGVGVVDMATTTKSSPEYFTDELHMNGEGNRLRAVAIRRHIDALPAFK